MEKERRYWIISDTHFGHHKMVEYCGRPEDFSEKILKNMLRLIEYNDVLIHLGDICIGNDAKNHGTYLAPVYCKKWLIRGNHDRKSDNWYLNYGWDMVCDRLDITYHDKMISFSHVPLLDVPGDINIHGHFHNNDHRRCESELVNRMTEKHRLFCLEHHYEPKLLSNLIK